MKFIIPLYESRKGGWIGTEAYLHDHHVAVKSTPSAGLKWSIDAATDLGHDRAPDGHVRDKVAIHDVHMEPVGTLVYLPAAVISKIGEVSTENRGSDNGGRRHGDYGVRWDERRRKRKKK